MYGWTANQINGIDRPKLYLYSEVVASNTCNCSVLVSHPLFTNGGKIGANCSLLGAEPEPSQHGGCVEDERLRTGGEELARHGHQETGLTPHGGAHDRIKSAYIPQERASEVEDSTEVYLMDRGNF